MVGDESPLEIALNNGRTVGVSLCDCGRCRNEWYVPNHADFTPKFCPYCGLKFVYVTESEKLMGLPELTTEEKAALDQIPDDAVDHWLKGEKWDFKTKQWTTPETPNGDAR
jgi:hypothetical protein